MASLFACVVVGVSCEGKSSRPNFIFILADDLGWSDTSVAMDPADSRSRSDYIETPNLEKLASNGVVFSNAYSPAPLCTPTRRSIQFGMTPARQHGTEFLGTFDPAPHLSIAQMLKKIDPAYYCVHFGKWGSVFTGTFPDAESHKPGLPDRLGYDASDGKTGNNTGVYYHQRLQAADHHRNFKTEVLDDPKLTFSVSERACRFLKEQNESERPFYMQVSYYAVHTAAKARLATLEKYKKKGLIPVQASDGIAPMTEDMDDGIGMILDTLTALGLDENTFVFFTSDNGGEVLPEKYRSELERDRLDRSHPLRGSKHSLYEGGIRVPFIVSGPGVPKGSHSLESIVGYDLWSTLYDLAGGAFPISGEIDAASFRSLLLDPEGGSIERPGPGLVFHRPKNKTEPQSALRAGKYKLIVNWDTRGVELFDLDEDPDESNDLSIVFPQVRRRMLLELIAYLEAVEAEGDIELLKEILDFDGLN
ncbi:sulfatase-like hydrolase/transferase [Pelagicoccus mobilis]|uniref:Sulfatase-like hydrolase/transferase n=1 Tax=Pelagicoccus mobilis TaxID=415221 RepID=A0A934RZ26_9BACT|nr:sulfatase-like hydrolase/transferase [Pelagicoccus mobilis]